MDIDFNNILSRKSLIHAKYGNFSGFRVSLPVQLSEDNSRFLFNNIRSLLSEITEETESWFNYEEFEEYCANPTNKAEQLNEIASLQTRIKLSRAAKRTSKRRARKRFMRRKIRKNKDQLAKRAYGQVKNILRKRLTGGRDWSSIPISSRIRIDAAINRRKSILTRMVKTRIPRMASQETVRLQRVRINSSFELPTNTFLFEDNARQEVTRQNKARQQKHRASLSGNISSFMNNLMMVKNKNGKEMIITKQSYNKSEHEVIEAPGKVTMSAAKGLTRRSSFDQTPTSVKLFGLMGDVPAAKKKKQPKEKEASMTTSNGTQSAMPAAEIAPPPPREGVIGPGSIYVDSEHSADQMGLSAVLALNLLTGGYSPGTIIGELRLSQQYNRSIEAGAKTTPEEKKSAGTLEKMLKSFGFPDDMVNLLMNSQTLLEAGIRSIGPLLENKNLTGIPGGDLGNYFGVYTDNLLFPTTSSYKNDSGSSNEEKANSNIILFNRGFISDNAGKNELDPKQLDVECRKHLEVWNIAMGRVADDKGKEIKKSESDKAVAYVDAFLEKYGNSGMIGLSVKTGESAILIGNIRGDSNAMVQYVLRLEEVADDGEKIIEPLWKKTIKNYEEYDSKGQNITLPVVTITASAKLRNQEKFHREITEELMDTLCKDKDFVYAMVHQSLTGLYKFSEMSPATAVLVLTHNNDGTNSAITELTEEYSIVVGTNTKVRVGIKSGYIETQEDLQAGAIFDEAVMSRSKEMNIDITSAKKEIRKEIREMRNNIDKKMREQKISLDDATNAKFEELVNSGISKREAQEKITLRERLHRYKTVLDIIAKLNRPVNQSVVIERFTYNPIMRVLMEAKISQKDAAVLADETDTSKQEYLESTKNFIGNDISKLLIFLDSTIDVVAFSDIDLRDYANKETNGLVNRIYMNGEITDIQVDKEVDYEKLMSEFHERLGKMFLSEAKKRDYKKEYEDYHGTAKHIKERSKRVLARRALEKMGRVHKGDGKDVDHKDGNPMNNSTDNLRVMDASTNRAKH